MAVRYVKDFEFPSASGYTKSATPVTGQMYAKGGEAKAPKGKGVMLIIGVGSPKGPMKKAEGGYSDMDDYMSQLEKKSPIQSGTYGKKKPDAKKKPPTKSSIPGTNVEASDIMDADERARLERGYAKGGGITPDELKSQYAAGAKRSASMSADDRRKEILDQVERSGNYPRLDALAKKKGGKVAKVMREFGEGKLHSGSKKGPEVTSPKQAVAIALSEARQAKKSTGGKIEYEDGGKDTSVPAKDIKSGKVKQSRDADYYREMGQTKKPMMKAKGGSVHEDEAMDKALIKKMVKPEARVKKKFGDGGMNDMGGMSGRNRGPITQPGPMPDVGPGNITQPGPMAGGGRGNVTQPGPMTGGGLDSLGSGPKKLNMTAEQYQQAKAQNTDIGQMSPEQRAQRREAMGLQRDQARQAKMDRFKTFATSRPTAAAVPDRVTNPMARMAQEAAAMRKVQTDIRQAKRAGFDVQSAQDARGATAAGAQMAMKSGGKVKSPLQSMGLSPRGMSLKQAKGVPATSRAPLIAPLAMGMGQGKPAVGSGGVGVNEARPGKPNVGAIRSAMAKAATAANPDASPAMMKRGGKASMSKC